MTDHLRNENDTPIHMDANEALRQPPAREMEFLQQMEKAYNQEHYGLIEENIERLQRLDEDCQDRIQALSMIQQRIRNVMQRNEPSGLPSTDRPGSL